MQAVVGGEHTVVEGVYKRRLWGYTGGGGGGDEGL